MNAMTRTLPTFRSARLALRVGACALLAGATPALAQRAGSPIVNIATADVTLSSGTIRVASNAATLRLDEVLDIGLAAGATGVTTGGTQPAAPFVLTNAGNGNERFVLAATLSGATGTIRGFALDANGNGVFDAGDALLNDAQTPALAPGQVMRLLALLDPATAATEGAALDIFARALTGSGAPGTVYRGRGDQGVDAIVGKTTAEATLHLPLVAGAVPGASLVKSQSVTRSDGTAGRPVPGAIITYSLAARFENDGIARAATIEDSIPDGTDYVPGSLTLDGIALSDASDSDAGSFDGTRIAVALGTIAKPQTRNVQFKVTIQ